MMAAGSRGRYFSSMNSRARQMPPTTNGSHSHLPAWLKMLMVFWSAVSPVV